MNALHWFEFLASYAIQVGLVIAIAATLDRWCLAANFKSQVWNACFLSVLGLVVVGLLLPRLQLVHPWSTLQPKSLLMVAQIEVVLGVSMLMVWVLGLAVMLTRWGIRCAMMHRFARDCVSLTESQFQFVKDCTPQDMLSIGNRPVEFRICPEEFGPFCYQLHQPYVFLPGSFLSGDSEFLRLVLYHELTHLNTQHPLQLFCQKLVQCLLWFHPLVWICSHRAALVREFVCDDATASQAQSTAAYVKALVKVAEGSLNRQDGTLAIGNTKGELLTRAQRLIRNPSRIDSEVGPDASRGNRAVIWMLIATLLCSQLWLPTNPLASQRSSWSPWPTWSAEALHAVNVTVRDFETFQHGRQIHEWIEATNLPASSSPNP